MRPGGVWLLRESERGAHIPPHALGPWIHFRYVTMHGQYVTMDGQQIPIYSTQATTAVREGLREAGRVTAVLTEVKEVVQA